MGRPKAMKLEHDRRADAIYIWLRPDVEQAFGLHLDDSRYVDYGDDNLPIGIELLHVSQGVNLDDLPEREAVGELLGRNKIKVFA
jgi:uncharacterized protein YuzE